MKLVSFEQDGLRAYGIAVEGGIVNLRPRLGHETLKDLLAAGDLDRARGYAADAPDIVGPVSYLPVVWNPMHLWCLALNYVEHNSEMNNVRAAQDLPKKPALFLRAADSMTGHERPLQAPVKASEKFDYEGELAVIIGKPGRNVSEADAMDHVAGYAVFNDGSIRDWQFHTKQITPGKNFYQTAALGPHMVTSDEIADPHRLGIRTWLNDQLVQDGNSADMLFNIPAFIAYVSTIAPLTPGDVLATGTPSGVGVARTPQLWMKPGDRCTIEIEGIGRLSNPVEAA